MSQLITKFNSLPSAFIQQNVLCFDSWTDPVDFVTMSTESRQLLRLKYTKMAVTPTESNYWIWFGSYNKTRQTPRFYDMSVASLLYNMFITKTTGRVFSRTALSSSDVNPYKYSSGHAGVKKLVKEMCLGNSQVPVQTEDKGLEKCLDAIQMAWDEDLGLTRAWYEGMLTGRGFSNDIIETALSRCGYELK